MIKRMLKKMFLLIFVLALSCSKDGIFIPSEETFVIIPLEECINGFAGEYPCNDYDLLAHISLADMNSGSGNDCWGWTDPLDNKEYALMGTNNGITFIDITNPTDVVILGSLSTRTVSSSWRDVKVHNSVAYIVSEAADHGMQVFNLEKLRDVANPPIEFQSDFDYTDFGKAHNIVINEAKDYVYPVGTNRSGTYKGGPLFINVQDPLNPIDEGGFINYSHDAQVVTYNGPDTEHIGKEILIGSNEVEVVIVDITDKSNPIRLSSISYTNVEYTHQGWFTEDFKYFILGDELDELRKGMNTRSIILDFTDLDNPLHHFDYLGNSAAVDHNGYVKGNTYYQANYTAGVRMLDLSNIENKSISEIGFFDTYPENDNTASNGVWSVYPYFPSGNIIISDINRGFFVIRKSGS
ncbi:MAG: choice-of-anchor B domain-containing protein [Polaribacter sp.]|jgi:choice-of-anchor B domain-containing protein